MFGDMFGKVTRQTPISVISGFGEFGDTDTTIEGALATITDALTKYLKSQQTTQTVTTQSVIPPTISGISPIWLIGGGVLAWYLFKKYKGKAKGGESSV